MQKRIPFAFAALAALPALSILGGCTTDDSADAIDSGTVTDAGAGDSTISFDANPGPQPDASKRVCTLNDSSDPVGLCIQKAALQAIHDAVVDLKNGVGASWSVDTGLPDTDGGATVHDPRDDIAYAAALAGYSLSAGTYGDNELDPVILSDLDAIAVLALGEMPMLADEYDGSIYFRLRRIAVALSDRNYQADADKINAAAEQYASQILGHYHSLGASTTGDGGVEEWGVLSTDPSAPFGYDAAKQVTGALALIDLAARHGGGTPIADAGADADAGMDGGADAEAGADADTDAEAGTVADAGADADADAGSSGPSSDDLQRAAKAVLDHAYARARHASGLYYCDLMTSADPDHDQLSTWLAQPDMLETDAQTSVAWALSRGVDLVAQNPSLGVLASYPFEARAEGLMNALNAQTLPFFDPTNGGYLEGYEPTGAAFDYTKAVIPNAWALAALHRLFVAGQPAVAQTQLKPLRERLTLKDGTPGFLGAVSGQTAYFAQLQRDFTLPSADAGSSIARSYSTQATATACEALNDSWFGRSGGPAAY